MKYAVIIDGLTSFRIGQAVKVGDDHPELCILEDGQYCDCIQKSALRFIEKEEFDTLQVKTEFINNFCEE